MSSVSSPKASPYRPVETTEVPPSFQIMLPEVEFKGIYVILPYFNYCGFRRRKELFIEFVARFASQPGVQMVVVEAIERGQSSHFSPSDLPNTLFHLHIETEHCIWIKENLINLAIARLPPLWNYVAWIDADLTFLNTKWVTETLEALGPNGPYDILQLFQTCSSLGPNGDIIKTDKSFGMMSHSGKPYTKTHKYGFWHPGFAWACHRRAFEQMGGLVDWGILGSGDHHMALALIGKVDISHPGNIHPAYVKRLKAFETRVRTPVPLRLGYITGTILHHWHGSIADRKYQERWGILTRNHYDPDTDIYFTSTGVLQLTPAGLRLHPEIRAYFVGRREDNTEA